MVVLDAHDGAGEDDKDHGQPDAECERQRRVAGVFQHDSGVQPDLAELVLGRARVYALGVNSIGFKNCPKRQIEQDTCVNCLKLPLCKLPLLQA